jgi:hypothetical protein
MDQPKHQGRGNMQNKKNRYFGMSVTQLIVLACMGIVLLGVLGFGAKLVLDNVTALAAPPDQSIQEVRAPAIPSPTHTAFPSRTPILPTPTFTATTYASLIPEGWNQQKYEKVEFWVPADFEKNSKSEDLIGLANKQPGTHAIHANVSLSKDTGILTDLDGYVQQGVKQFTQEVTYLEKKDFEIGTYEARRLRMEVIISNVPIEEAIYFIKDGDTVWIISGFSEITDFHDWLPIFDKIARTFRITP